MFLGAVLVCLNGCTYLIGDTVSGESHGVTADDASSQEESAAASSAETTEESESAQVKALYQAATELLLLDKQVIDIFANLAPAEYAVDLSMEDYGYRVGDTYYKLRDDCPYADYSALQQLLALTYGAESGVAEKYLNGFPTYGYPVFRSDYEGKAQFCCQYDAEFYIYPRDAELRFTGATEGGYGFVYTYGADSYAFEITATPEGYRLNNSLLFIAEAAAIAAGGSDTISENIGSAKVLKGNCLWVNVFVGCFDSSWDEASRADVKEMVTEAGDYIVTQGQNYGVTDLCFEYLWTDTRLDISAPDYLTGATWAVDAFEDSCYGDFDGFAQSTTINADWDNVFFMFHFNCHGRSFSIPCDRNVGEDSKYYYENCVLFYSLPEDGEYFACPAVYMHELLHLFGAADLYSGTVSDKGAALAKLYFEHDIMLYEPTDITDCYIGDLTAKLLGWTEGLSPQLKDVIER